MASTVACKQNFSQHFVQHSFVVPEIFLPSQTWGAILRVPWLNSTLGQEDTDAVEM